MESPNSPKYIVGIDLGTTHCVMAYTDWTEARSSGAAEDEAPEVRLFEIPQVVGAGEVKAQPLLPAFLLLPGPHDVPEGALALPWKPDIDYTVGEFARNRGAELPTRLVASAKSWLSHTGVDRTQAVLPWDSPPDARRVSPLDAATRYLSHLRHAWDYHMAAEDREARLENQEVYLTVPASFDAVARELTVQAARAAGLAQLTLLEEPQAAFYAWLESQADQWRDIISVGESVLVCDVGGGTTDFSLVEVTENDGTLELRRAAVGNHILLGGDNMDLTLAYAVRGKLAQEGTQLDSWQFRGLWYQCRKAKERLLGNPNLDTVPVVVVGRGSSLIGGTIRTELTRQEIETILVNGFFPDVDATDFPEHKPKVGMREMGLPYESDPAVTRHLAYFLSRQAESASGPDARAGGVAFPSAVLFNGGVMKAEALRTQILSVLRRWSANDELRELPSIDLDQAVALGAAYYGLARQGRGIRIRAGTARSYYIGIESAMPAVPGIPTPIKALCVVPFGMEEGTNEELRGREFGLVVGDQAVFTLLSASTRKGDQPGDVVEDWSGDIEEVATMEAFMDVTEADEGGTVLPVWLESRVTEIGTLELWCVSRDDTDKRWKLEFNIREEQEA